MTRTLDFLYNLLDLDFVVINNSKIVVATAAKKLLF